MNVIQTCELIDTFVVSLLILVIDKFDNISFFLPGGDIILNCLFLYLMALSNTRDFHFLSSIAFLHAQTIFPDTYFVDYSRFRISMQIDVLFLLIEVPLHRSIFNMLTMKKERNIS